MLCPLSRILVGNHISRAQHIHRIDSRPYISAYIHHWNLIHSPQHMNIDLGQYNFPGHKKDYTPAHIVLLWHRKYTQCYTCIDYRRIHRYHNLNNQRRCELWYTENMVRIWAETDMIQTGRTYWNTKTSKILHMLRVANTFIRTNANPIGAFIYTYRFTFTVNVRMPLITLTANGDTTERWIRLKFPVKHIPSFKRSQQIP